jgi:6,7-dimethyl-8-ribityllumazine synthase
MIEINMAESLEGEGIQVGIVCSRFNAPVCDELLNACTDELKALGVDTDDITIIRVPGALEIPLALQTLLENLAPDTLIALGAVIRGETYHFELVANESAAGITRLQQNMGVPVANGILTTDTDEQAFARAAEKGRDCARTAIEMAMIIETLGVPDDVDTFI